MTTPRCTRCHRPLHSAKSIAAGKGRTCAKRERQEAVIAAQFADKRHLVAKAQELLESGGVVPLRGRVYRTAGSHGARYLTAPEACNCAAGLKAKHVCHHRIAVILKAA
jgi:hypothetical protein